MKYPRNFETWYRKRTIIFAYSPTLSYPLVANSFKNTIWTSETKLILDCIVSSTPARSNDITFVDQPSCVYGDSRAVPHLRRRVRATIDQQSMMSLSHPVPSRCKSFQPSCRPWCWNPLREIIIVMIVQSAFYFSKSPTPCLLQQVVSERNAANMLLQFLPVWSWTR